MKRKFKWFVEHPIWTFIGSVLGIIGIIGAITAWLTSSDPELEALKVLLRDVSVEAAYVARFSSYSSDQKNGMLGGHQAWRQSIINRIEYTQRAVDSVRSSPGYSRLTDQGRSVFNIINSNLEKYKAISYLNSRTLALNQQVCGLIVNSFREIAAIKNYNELVECFPITSECKDKILMYGFRIDVDAGGC